MVLVVKNNGVSAPQVGVYLLKRDNVVVYVGRTNAFAKRISQHVTSDKEFDDYIFIPCDGDVSMRVESSLIYHLQP